MKVFQAVFNEDSEGIYALSLVYDPAVQDTLIHFNTQKLEFSTIDAEQRLIMGALLIPDQKILRKDAEGNEFFITFSKDTIKKIGHDFFSKGASKNFTEEHVKPLEGIKVVEGWTVSDSEKDKSVTFGKTYPEGTLVAMSKVENDDTWSKIQSGEITGYSIEALIGLEKLTLNNVTMTKQDFQDMLNASVDSIKLLFNSDKAQEQSEEINAESEEVAAEVAEETDAAEDVQAEAVDAEGLKAEFSSMLDAKVSELKTEFSKEKEDFETKLAEKEAKIKELEVQLSKQPEAEAVTVTPSTAERKQTFEKPPIETTISRVRENLGNNFWN